MGAVKYNFDDAVIVITGGARGQGLSHALSFAASGAHVVIIDCSHATDNTSQYPLCDASDLAAARVRLQALSKKSIVLDLDIRQEKAQAQAADKIAAQFGRIDCLIHNAGVNIVKDYLFTTTEDWDNIHQINLRAPFFLTKYLSPLLSHSSASVILISSLAAIKSVPKQVAYTAAKAGILGLMRSLAVELGPRGIRVNAVCPSLVISPQSLGLAKALKNAGEEKIPPSLGKLSGISNLKAEDITEIVLWLASDGARCVTGQVIIADAGRAL